MTKGLDVKLVLGREPDCRKAKQVRAFQWDSTRCENGQIAEYSQYLSLYLDATLEQNGLCLLDATRYPGILTIEDSRFEFDLSGTTG
ncbi:unnamed protein product, partial [Aphanomyces euteiches]